MNVPMAVFGEAAVLPRFMELVSTAFMFVVVGAIIYWLLKRYKKAKSTKKGYSVVVVWIGTLATAIAVLLSSGAGLSIGLFVNDALHLSGAGAFTGANYVFVGAVCSFLVAGVLACLEHEPKPRSERTKSGRKTKQADQSTASGEPEYQGTEFFSGIGH